MPTLPGCCRHGRSRLRHKRLEKWLSAFTAASVRVSLTHPLRPPPSAPARPSLTSANNDDDSNNCGCFGECWNACPRTSRSSSVEEAALNLGCVPRRVSKSQHGSNPGCYLSPMANDVRSASLKISDSNRPNLDYMSGITPSLSNAQNSASQFPSWYTALFKPTHMTCSSFPEIKFNNSDVPRGHANSTIFNRGGCPIATKPPASYQERVSGPLANCTTPNPSGVYPLYYSDNQPAVVSCPSFQIIRGPRHHLATDTTHCAESHGEAEIHFAVSPIGNRNTIGASRGDSSYMETSKIGWDLSLRLGLPSPPSFEESTWTNDHEDAGSNNLSGVSKYYGLPIARESAINLRHLMFP
ncbi:hypothetical protein B296_00032370 [Ensete ventricosum]|uniref:Uncharacterized protein n=1 Tax=Ensete ventricosum TaxID=4639 RepID=A0A426ZEB5_ENSVE|nr:hypothetical protein B296_00032370 [Ensete ventricosum]